MGHAGAIISGSAGTAQAKKEALEKVGVQVGRTPSETARLVREVMRGQPFEAAGASRSRRRGLAVRGGAGQTFGAVEVSRAGWRGPAGQDGTRPAGTAWPRHAALVAGAPSPRPAATLPGLIVMTDSATRPPRRRAAAPADVPAAGEPGLPPAVAARRLA